MFQRREDEPQYAILGPVLAPSKNRYGKSVQLVDEKHPLAGKSLNINLDPAIGDNPNRYKQHGFYFNADNCISCHACESACSEKNNLPPHLAFRSVGYVEGGSYPDYRRLNISMACNHCDDPVCLKGCPTRAYTKFAEYGAVLQDPDICFGCGYCTWVCPYNAPQLDPVNGQVEKCNMCVDRLEAGLKPACASACLAGALDFGVIETRPENRDQLETRIPGFPDPAITHPNIRFQQTRSLPTELTRPDSAPLRYVRDEKYGNAFRPRPRVSKKSMQWNLRKLSSRENPLVVFTLLSQATIGAFMALFLGDQAGIEELKFQFSPATHTATLLVLCMLQALALFMSTIHLGKPMRFYRGFNNLRYSPVSREAASLMVFFGAMGIVLLLDIWQWWTGANRLATAQTGFSWIAAVFGPLALYFMHRIYRISARPFWNHWQVLTSFFGNMLSLGSLVIIIIYGTSILASGGQSLPLLLALAPLMMTGLVLELAGRWFHARAMRLQGGEGEASLVIQNTEYGKTARLRDAMALGAVVLLAGLYLIPAGELSVAVFVGAAALTVTQSVISRALFYVLIIPTTMPGAFFWRNKGFQEHARETGLAAMPQVGVPLADH